MLLMRQPLGMSDYEPRGAMTHDQLLSASTYYQRETSKHPEWLTDIQGHATLEAGDITRAIKAAAAGTEDEASLNQCLRIQKHRFNCIIIWRDLCAEAQLDEIMLACTELADALLQLSCDWWFEKLKQTHGTPMSAEGESQQLTVLGMGKLGGGELNFSSDIDLIACYPDAGETDHSRPLSNQQFFTKVMQKAINSLSMMTADGFVYRVDMRLRPFGKSGPLVISFDALEHYLHAHAREWERYAMVKARVVVGGEAEKEAIKGIITPFIYRRYLDYSAAVHLADMRKMIAQHARNHQHNLKTGHGGIREIEFIVQSFQLIRGGQNKALQQVSLLGALSSVEASAYLTTDECTQLRQAYVLLRRCENRLQMINDEQTHTLDESLLSHPIFTDHQGINEQLVPAKNAVNGIFNSLFDEHDGDESLSSGSQTPGSMMANLIELDSFSQDIESTPLLDVLRDSAPTAFNDEALDAIIQLRHSGFYNRQSQQTQSLIEKILPTMIDACLACDDCNTACIRLTQLIRVIAGRPGYLVLLSSNDALLNRLVEYLSMSKWLSDTLQRHPILLDELLIPEEPDQLQDEGTAREMLDADMLKRIEYIDQDDAEVYAGTLRQFKLSWLFRVVSLYMFERISVVDFNRAMTIMAEVLLEHAHIIAVTTCAKKWKYERHHYDDVAVLAYGKLGSKELGLGSDLDLVFIYDDQSQADAVPYVRYAQALISILTMPMYDGKLYEVDARLRPNGQSGMLVSSFTQYRKYLSDKAWAWEHQALVKARCVIGKPELRDEFEQTRYHALKTSRHITNLATEVKQMRDRLYKEKPPLHDNDVKRMRGGMIDIEFIAQYAAMTDIVQQRENLDCTSTQSLLQASSIDKHQVELLNQCYRTYLDISLKSTLYDIYDAGDVNACFSQVVEIYELVI